MILNDDDKFMLWSSILMAMFFISLICMYKFTTESKYRCNCGILTSAIYQMNDVHTTLKDVVKITKSK